MEKPTLDDIVQLRTEHTQVSDESVDPNNVRKVQCSTCPWREDGLELTPEHIAALEIQVLTDSNQRCHQPALESKPETQVCRGARNHQLVIFHRLGVLSEPTDRCWKETLERIRSELSILNAQNF